jgi:hypothetical protein
LFVFAWLRSIGNLTVRRFALLGVLGGLAALVRWQDLAIVLVCPACELISALRRRSTSVGAVAMLVGVMAIATAVVASPQLLAWRVIYGDYLLIPQGTSFMRWTKPALLSVLFSTRQWFSDACDAAGGCRPVRPP